MNAVHFFNEIDIAVFHFLNSALGVSPYFDGAIFFCAQYLPFILPALLVLLLIRSKYTFNQSVLVIVTSLVAVVLARVIATGVIRYFYHRVRPFAYLHLQPLFIVSSDSFPSGHATLFFAFAFVVYFYNKRWGYGFITGAIAISIARVMAGVHYPTDILVGAFIGWASAYLAYLLAVRYMRVTRKKAHA